MGDSLNPPFLPFLPILPFLPFRGPRGSSYPASDS